MHTPFNLDWQGNRWLAQLSGCRRFSLLTTHTMRTSCDMQLGLVSNLQLINSCASASCTQLPHASHRGRFNLFRSPVQLVPMQSGFLSLFRVSGPHLLSTTPPCARLFLGTCVPAVCGQEIITESQCSLDNADCGWRVWILGHRGRESISVISLPLLLIPDNQAEICREWGVDEVRYGLAN